MQTNRNFYRITTLPSTRCYVAAYDKRCAQLMCFRCRHGAVNRDPTKCPLSESCSVSWLAAPHDQPLDVREPWTPQPPEVEPNPL